MPSPLVSSLLRSLAIGPENEMALTKFKMAQTEKMIQDRRQAEADDLHRKQVEAQMQNMQANNLAQFLPALAASTAQQSGFQPMQMPGVSADMTQAPPPPDQTGLPVVPQGVPEQLPLAPPAEIPGPPPGLTRPKPPVTLQTPAGPITLPYKEDVEKQKKEAFNQEMAKALILTEAKKKPAQVGSFEDYLTKKYGPQPTATQIEQGRKKYTEEGRAAPILGGMNALYGQIDPQAIGDAIISGAQPPTIQTLGRPAGAAVASYLSKQGYNLTNAQLDFQGMTRAVASMNSTQQLRMRQAAETARESLDVIDNLAGQWKGGQFPILNKANLIAARNGIYGPDAQQIATQLEAQINDVTSELGNVYMGGNSPTDHALQLAGKNLSASWDEKTLKKATQLARTNLSIRLNSMNLANTGAAAGVTGQGNPYMPQQPAATAPAGALPAETQSALDRLFGKKK